MSILIKGMEMPKGRPICIVIGTAGQARRYDLNNDRYADDKLFEAVPVPPHGRLIDADELVALVYANIALFDSIPDRLGADQKLVREWLRSMADDINEAPTIIPATE
jgi:hypothetical protein